MSVKVSVDASDFLAGMKAINTAIVGTGSRSTTQYWLTQIAQDIIKTSIQSPIPIGEPGETLRPLWSSWFIDEEGSYGTGFGTRKGTIVFGFNRRYATFQDQPDRTGEVPPIRPRPPKKYLFIPQNKEARLRHNIGQNPEDEGLERGKDYKLVKEVRIKIKSYGTNKGPNHYFSHTFRKFAPKILPMIRDKFRETLQIVTGARSAFNLRTGNAFGWSRK